MVISVCVMPLLSLLSTRFFSVGSTNIIYANSSMIYYSIYLKWYRKLTFYCTAVPSEFVVAILAMGIKCQASSINPIRRNKSTRVSKYDYLSSYRIRSSNVSTVYTRFASDLLTVFVEIESSPPITPGRIVVTRMIPSTTALNVVVK